MAFHCTHVQVPEGVDVPALIKNAMDKYELEIAGGLGPTAGEPGSHLLLHPSFTFRSSSALMLLLFAVVVGCGKSTAWVSCAGAQLLRWHASHELAVWRLHA